MPRSGSVPPPPAADPARNQDRWRSAGRAMLAKMIGEFSYEELLNPESVPGGYRLALPDGPEYRLAARRGAYGGWQVDPGSVRADGAPAEDPLAFLLAARGLLGLSGDTSG